MSIVFSEGIVSFYKAGLLASLSLAQSLMSVSCPAQKLSADILPNKPFCRLCAVSQHKLSTSQSLHGTKCGKCSASPFPQ